MQHQDHGLNIVDHIAPTIESQAEPHSAAPEFVPQLPSTVPDSQFVPNVESQVEFLPPTPAPNKTTAMGKMTSQESDATEVLSPSHYEGIIDRSRSARELEEEDEQDLERDWAQESDREEETALTLHPGDPGYVDLFSSPRLHKQGDSNVEEEQEQEDSEPIEVDFSPTQSQNALSQFPNSQRFKTPATAGKKRRYNGDVVDSPELPRNPLLRGGDTDDNAIPLSQVFAATQANTSPYVGNGITGLLSDRPSPNIDLQPRPMTATTSSPSMKPIPVFERAATEPATQYRTLKQSQDARDRKAELKRVKNNQEYPNSEEADLEIGENSWDYKERMRSERDQKIKALCSSSPRQPTPGVSLSRSSPTRGSGRAHLGITRSSKRSRYQTDSSPVKRGQQPSHNESEEETEQEDNADVISIHSSQSSAPMDDEDKENFSDVAIQIPETTARHLRVTSDLPSQAQESPLLRHCRSRNGDNHPLNSSQPFAVADSQPERVSRRTQIITQVPRSSAADEGPDFVPQSPDASPPSTALLHRKISLTALPPQAPVDAAEEQIPPVRQRQSRETDRIVPASNSQSRHPPQSTIPETSSNEPRVQIGIESDDKPENGDTASRGEFDTAQTHIQPSLTAAEQTTPAEVSSPQIVATPQGKRRTRLADIAAEPSPFKSQISFDASEALRLDANFRSPSKVSPTSKRTIAEVAKMTETPVGHSEATQEEAPSPDIEQQDVHHPHNDPGCVESHDLGLLINGSEPPKQSAPLSNYPKRERRPTAKALSARNGQSQTTIPAPRGSQWELDDSSPQKIEPVGKPLAALKRKARASDAPSDNTLGKLSKRLKAAQTNGEPKSPVPETVDKKQESPDPIALNETSDLHDSKDVQMLDVVPESENEDIVAPNMVFGCFNGKSRTYHPALCLGRPSDESNRFVIQWEGYAPDEIDEHGVRSLDLRIGDQVKIELDGFPKASHVIRGFKDKTAQAHDSEGQVIVTDLRGYQTLLVAPKQRKSLPADMSTDAVKKVPVSAIYLDSVMWGQMKDRVYDHKPAVKPEVSSGTSTPMVRASTPSSPSSRSRRGTAAFIPPSPSAMDLTEGLFADIAFAISYEDSTRKRDLVDLIQDNGGTILNGSFLELFEPDSIVLKERFADFKFTALLTDRHSRKEKYLQALALGFPCLSGKWIETCVQADELTDWTTYLLPSGESAELEGATKSRILPLPSTVDSLKVKDLIASRAEMLANSRVIVVMGKGKAETRRKPYLSLIRSLGPSQVDLEPDLNTAKAIIASAVDGGDPVDYVFVDDRDVGVAKEMFLSTAKQKEPQPDKGRKRGRTKRRTSDDAEKDTKEVLPDDVIPKVKIMCNEDIVQSLILGRLWMGSS